MLSYVYHKSRHNIIIAISKSKKKNTTSQLLISTAQDKLMNAEVFNLHNLTPVSVVHKLCHTPLIARFVGPTWGPIWGRQDPCGPHVGHMNFAIWDVVLNVCNSTPKAHAVRISARNIFLLNHILDLCYLLPWIINKKQNYVRNSNSINTRSFSQLACLDFLVNWWFNLKRHGCWKQQWSPSNIASDGTDCIVKI